MTDTKTLEARRLAALLALAALEGGGEPSTDVMDEAYSTVGLPAVMAALVEGLCELLEATAGRDGSRATLNMTINDVEASLAAEGHNG
ncbi:hypothetical protein [Rhodococcus aetherivorans]|uniref:hypothetical protein n=1 Tax=Rhodococcus aetherivorans TaxID=191292 RepID=UPI00045D12E3|nr:hypothetical protein [Rhodococcus aetherivorans]KDE12426.1 hypothetical protein N505_0115370 [Rhodococcus aetherivorans]